MNTVKEQYVADLSVCQPASALSCSGEKNRWRSIQYETETGIAGNLLFAGEESLPEILTLPLNLKGRYKIFVGLGATLSVPGIRLKLTSDKCYKQINAAGRKWWLEILECFWKEANLDGENISIANVKGVQSCITYLRFEPVKDESASVSVASQDNPYYIVTNDSYAEYNSIEEVLEPIYALKDSPVKKLCFCVAHGDNCYYLNTKIGTRPEFQPNLEYARTLDRKNYWAMENLRRKEPDIIGKICDFTHEISLEFHASFRVEAFALQPPFDKYKKSAFYRKNPQLRCRDYDGREISRLSYAFEEVQEHMLALYEEVLQYDVDGLNFIFVRALPVMLYEEPLLKGFEEIHRKNPLELSENDPTYLEYRASILTGFMRKIRERIDFIRKQQNRKPLEISVICPTNQQVNEFFGLDLKTWAQEGLVDIICPDFSLQTRDHDDSDPNNIDLDYFQEIVTGTDCQLAPRLAHFTWEPEKYKEYFQRMQNYKLSGMLLWDGEPNFVRNPEVWEYVNNFGKVDLEKLPKRILLKSLGDFVTDKYPSHLAF